MVLPNFLSRTSLSGTDKSVIDLKFNNNLYNYLDSNYGFYGNLLLI